MSNVAIILGAGSGTRMKMEKSKLLLELNGLSVIKRSVDAFIDLDEIDRVIVTARKQDVDAFKACINDERVCFVIGGATRQESVKKAVDTVDDAELLVIHDGARPLIKSKDIINTINCAREHGAAATGVSVKDTIKVVDKNNYVIDTPNRASLFAVQTPQVFNFKMYKSALKKAVDDNMDFTDDCQLIEYSGGRVKMVQGSYDNIKITTPDDIALAENYLSNYGEIL